MSGRNTLLAVLLAVQLLIIAAVWLIQAGPGETPQGAWLTFDAAQVDEIELADGENGSLLLTRTGSGWRLPSGLPADAARITELLDSIAGLEASWPVATSGSAAQRFEVAPDQYQRHVRLGAAEQTVAEFYLGTSPGYQRVHARRSDDDAVYSIALSNYQLPAEPGDWLDKTLLAARGEVSAVSRDGAWRLQHGVDGWELDSPGEGAAPAQPDQDAAADLARRFSDLRVLDVAAPPAADAEPRATFRVTDADGEFVLRLYADSEGNDFRVTTDRQDGTFGLAAYLADRLLVDRATLVAADPTTADDLPVDDPSADEGSDEATPPEAGADSGSDS